MSAESLAGALGRGLFRGWFARWPWLWLLLRPASILLAAWSCLASILLASMLAGCGPKVDNSQVKLPAPVESTTLGPGDRFTLEVVGEKDLPKEYQVASDGSVDFPYVHRIQVEGLEPQEVAEAVRKHLIEARILLDPSVIVSVKEYNSKRVTVLGQVRKPGSFPLTTGMTLVQAISDAGGLNAIANGDRVNLTRKDKKASTTVVVSIDSIIEGRSPDIPLQAGDQIYVNERVF